MSSITSTSHSEQYQMIRDLKVIIIDEASIISNDYLTVWITVHRTYATIKINLLSEENLLYLEATFAKCC